MTNKQLLELLEQKIYIKPTDPKPLTADDYNKTMDTFVVKLNDMFKSLDQSKVTEQQGDTTENDKQ